MIVLVYVCDVDRCVYVMLRGVCVCVCVCVYVCNVEGCVVLG